MPQDTRRNRLVKFVCGVASITAAAGGVAAAAGGGGADSCTWRLRAWSLRRRQRQGSQARHTAAVAAWCPTGRATAHSKWQAPPLPSPTAATRMLQPPPQPSPHPPHHKFPAAGVLRVPGQRNRRRAARPARRVRRDRAGGVGVGPRRGPGGGGGGHPWRGSAPPHLRPCGRGGGGGVQH